MLEAAENIAKPKDDLAPLDEPTSYCMNRNKNFSLSPEVEEFLTSCKSLRTGDTYKSHLGRFFRFVDIEPAEFLKLQPKEIQAHVLRYAIFLKKEATTEINHANWKTGSFSVNSVGFMLNAVKVFLEYQDITIGGWKKIERFIPEKIKVHYHVYTREEIQKLLKVADFRERAIILVLLSSGMRASGLLGLWIKDLEIIEGKIGKLTVYARTDSYYHTFCTPEATDAIEFYLKWREDRGEQIRPTSPLVRDSIRKRARISNANTPSPLSRSRMWTIMHKLVISANLKLDGKRLQPEHSFRKFMNTAVANAKANPLFKEIMLGHSVKLDNIYYDKDNPESINALLAEYNKAMPSLTINNGGRLERKVQELASRLASDEERDRQITLMKDKQEQWDHILQQLIDQGYLKPKNADIV